MNDNMNDIKSYREKSGDYIITTNGKVSGWICKAIEFGNLGLWEATMADVTTGRAYYPSYFSTLTQCHKWLGMKK